MKPQSSDFASVAEKKQQVGQAASAKSDITVWVAHSMEIPHHDTTSLKFWSRELPFPGGGWQAVGQVLERCERGVLWLHSLLFHHRSQAAFFTAC